MPAPLPDDPESWGDEEWLAWLEEVDAEAPTERDRAVASKGPGTFTTLLGAAMLGVAKAIYGQEDAQIVMIVEADGDPPGPDPLEITLDPDDPDASTVTVRPWLEGRDDDGGEGGSEARQIQ